MELKFNVGSNYPITKIAPNILNYEKNLNIKYCFLIIFVIFNIIKYTILI